MYSVEETVSPFWASYASAASGRDPLAIQNSSVVIYTSMMVGITNVTIRIRYMGFFCWLFETILQKVEKKNSLTEQIFYLRRAELLLAHIMLHNYPDVTGISGTSYAGNNQAEVINLGLGADWENKQSGKKIYWQNSQGIFGQYYSGVMRTLGLINHPSEAQSLNIYTLSDEGNTLSDYYGEHIPIESQDLFWSSVTKGLVEKSQLSELQSFALHLIPSGSSEHVYYQKRILSEDSSLSDSAYHRRETLQLMLQFLERQQQPVTDPIPLFLKENYHLMQSNVHLENTAATAWYLFELNELVHVAYEHFHGCFLYSIQPHPTLLDDAIQTLTELTMNASGSILNISSTQTMAEWRTSLLQSTDDIYEYYQNMLSAFKERDYGLCLLYAMLVLMKAFNDTEPHQQPLLEYAALPSNNFNRHGYAMDLLHELVSSMEHLPLRSYVQAVLMKAINEHTFSSYSKTRIGQSLVHNYMIEEHSVWRLRETLPNRTTPRLQNALQYMVDLGWVETQDKKHQITEFGKQWMV